MVGTGNNRKIVKNIGNCWATFNLENVNFQSNPNLTPKNGVSYEKTCTK